MKYTGSNHVTIIPLPIRLLQCTILNVLFILIILSFLSKDDEYGVVGMVQPVQEQQQRTEEQVLLQRRVQDLSLIFSGMYIPTTDVTYQSTIDVDQKEIIDLLDQVTGTSTQDSTYINDAYSIYTQRLRLFSSTDGEIYRMDETEFFPFFTLYLNYMGDSDYAHDFISAGYNDTATTSGYSGNFKLNLYSLPGGLIEIIQYGTLLLSMVQYIIRDVDVAIQECIACPSDQNGTGTCGMNTLDEAVAYYIGSIQSTVSNAYDGYLLYAHAEQLCQFFNTCDGTITLVNSDGTTSSSTTRSSLLSSRVNMILIEQFRNIQQSLKDGVCIDAMMYRNIVVQQMFVPMIQGIIRSMYYTEQEIASEYCYADATIYGASILPLIYNCSNTDADLLYDQIKPGNDDDNIIRNATLVQEILERNYYCLGISSNDIGIYDPSIMVDFGRCGQPTPAPVVVETSNPKPVSSTTLDIPTITPNTIDISVSNSPTTFIQPVPPTSPTTTDKTSGSFACNNNNIKISIILLMIMTIIMSMKLLE
jgi:hypothetical protein